MNTGLTVTEWMSFLKDLHLKHLCMLEVEALCLMQGLVNILLFHELDMLIISSFRLALWTNFVSASAYHDTHT